jgi:hypothetical protein
MRKVSYPELRELAIVLKATIGELDAQVDFVAEGQKDGRANTGETCQTEEEVISADAPMSARD